MNKVGLFIDASVCPRSKVGYGAYLVVCDTGESLDSLQEKVKVKRFEKTSSSKLELQNLLWVLKDVAILESKVTIYTDSQLIVNLPRRREKLEQNDYFTRQHKRLKNYLLYQDFYRLIDMFDCCFVKVLGHQKSSKKSHIDHIFTLLDIGSRQALRQAILKNKTH
eukprot:COSAG01_NODE_621_length_14780_cov_1056.278591_6_plen_165_part_00